MAFDGKPEANVVLSDRARFALDLARHANEPYGERQEAGNCALARFFGGHHSMLSYDDSAWQAEFMLRFDSMRRQPTGFDCLAILQGIA